jgi:two-component system LytT family response regulator
MSKRPSATVLIVDDEPLARKRLRTLLEKHPGVGIAGECANGEEAVRAILDADPDIVFLDVQMPGISGFDVIDLVGPESMPAVIFVTAYDQFAVKAFDVHAVDYLLKPFDPERFHTALGRALDVLARGDAAASRLGTLSESVAARPGAVRRLLVKSPDRVAILSIDEIDWIESAGNYVTVHAGGQHLLHRETMTGILDRLDPSVFARIHRNCIVNIERVVELIPHFNGDYIVRLKDGTRRTLSRRYRESLSSLLGQF